MRNSAFLIHPLLENAIKHGAREDDDGPLRVRLDANVAGDMLRVEVWNTGSLGKRVSPVHEAGLADFSPHGLAGTGIGVRNVRERLARLFPGRHRFEFVTRTVGYERSWSCRPARPRRPRPNASCATRSLSMTSVSRAESYG